MFPGGEKQESGVRVSVRRDHQANEKIKATKKGEK